MAFVRALSTTDLGEGQGRCVTLSGKKIAIFHANGRWFAIDDTCTHEDASLAEGSVVEHAGQCSVECPWHGAQFDLATGAALTLPAVKPVKTYPVRVQGTGVEVDVT